MKRLITFTLCILLLIRVCHAEESKKKLPDGFYELEVVKEALVNQIKDFREFTPEQLEVVYLASKYLHEEYFGTESSECETIEDMRLPQGEYIIGELIPAGNYRFSLLDREYDIVTLWVEKPGRSISNYYSMTSEKPEVILHLEEGWTLRVTYADTMIAKVETIWRK